MSLSRSIRRDGSRAGGDGAIQTELRRSLESLRDEAHRARTVERDPLSVVIGFTDPADQEVAGLIAALLAYGRVDLLRAHARTVLEHLGDRPAKRLRSGIPELPPMSYRFHRAADLSALLRGIRALLLGHGSLGAAFSSHWSAAGDLRGALTGFVHELRAAAGPAGPGLRFLLADPALGGACKRWHLYLRWMVRHAEADPDPGPWRDRVPAASLLVPLDTHLVRVSGRLGFTRRRTVDWKMAEEVTAALRRLSPEDPIRYDLPLCHLGIRGSCPPRLTSQFCSRCPLRPACPTGRRRCARSAARLERRAGPA
jgi:uncharacterized protein (TIGR02757 family)